jgi:cytochrome P450
MWFQYNSNSSSYSTYSLAKNPDIQTKLQAEIDEHWKEGEEELNYEIISDMTYMDYVVREVLRMYRVSAQNSTRLCNETSTVCGHTLRKVNKLY